MPRRLSESRGPCLAETDRAAAGDSRAGSRLSRSRRRLASEPPRAKLASEPPRASEPAPQGLAAPQRRSRASIGLAGAAESRRGGCWARRGRRRAASAFALPAGRRTRPRRGRGFSYSAQGGRPASPSASARCGRPAGSLPRRSRTARAPTRVPQAPPRDAGQRQSPQHNIAHNRLI